MTTPLAASSEGDSAPPKEKSSHKAPVTKSQTENNSTADNNGTTTTSSDEEGRAQVEDSMTAPAVAKKSLQDDATIAQVFQAIETLEIAFGFSPEVAQQAIEAVGTDVTAAYNFILDQGLAEDQGGPIVPIDNCPHVQHHVMIEPDQLPCPNSAPCSYIAPTGIGTGSAKDDVANDGSCSAIENWVCLQCGVVRCSRYFNAHGVKHYEESVQTDPGPDQAGHCIAASLADLSVWCHSCQAYLKDATVQVLVKKLEELKFGAKPLEGQEGGDQDRGDHDDDEENESVNEVEKDDDDRHIARGVPILLGSEESEEIEYPFEPPQSLSDVAKFILSDKCQSIAILAGAGMSVASGIPDFRSAGGLYDTLRPSLLTASDEERDAIQRDPTTALDMTLFLQNPLPCLELNRPFILGTRDQVWRATLAHRFVELLHMKTGKLTRLYQQNIDGLEGQCHNLPREKVVMVHGSMDTAECAICRTEMDFQSFCALVEKNIKDLSGEDPNAPTTSKPIACNVCGYEAMKPSIVLFKSPLPPRFFECAREDISDVDLLLVIGTSLAVAPANTLVFLCPHSCMRVVMNRESVGHRLGIDYSMYAERDFFAQGDIDNVVLDLVNELGWLDDITHLCGDSLPEASAEALKGRLHDQSSVKRQRVEDGETFRSSLL